MLKTRSIPVFGGDRPDDWHIFLYKASRGSIKAIDTLSRSSMAYMVALTGDPLSPATMQVGEYNELLKERFSPRPPVSTVQELQELAVKFDWIAEPFRVSDTPRNSPNVYCGLWGKRAVDCSALINDSMLMCLSAWAASHMIECTDHYDTNYDARMVTCGMLYLSLTWPGT